MRDKILEIENRIRLLESKDPVRNMRIINKLKRKLRAMGANA
jgi:hypothetical protein